MKKSDLKTVIIDGVEYIPKEEPKEEKKKFEIEYDEHYSVFHNEIDVITPNCVTLKESKNKIIKHGLTRKTEQNAEYSQKRNQRANRLEALVEELQGELGVGDCYVIHNTITNRYGYRCEPNGVEVGIVKMKEETAIKICEILNNEEYKLDI